ncbi:DUF1990 domain-containing protein [Nocardioides sp.]|uniref:DUF1990 family protein n=1 Tax=Nocardioides sp. TaxID=35761 RepID=UPI0026199850|nr:DUF1990 domain-containing protein [Nocardioides sp.]MCW2737182.1 hypothetical protein [Nocardioides sp.]
MTYSYGEVGATRSVESMPRDAHWVVERRLVGGPSAFDPAADFVLGFGMQRAGGFRVTASSPTAVVGTSLTLRRWFGPVRITARTQVVYVVDEPARRGFAYGTLPGHPESGEELFLVERTGEETWAEIRAFSRPGRWFTRLGGPVVRLLQTRSSRAYLDGVARVSGGATLRRPSTCECRWRG